jgi:PIN domain nuclease of toxin-antitoxin system
VTIVVDASAVIALLAAERFDRFNPAELNGAAISAVNLAEVLTRLRDLAVPADRVDAALAELSFDVAAFDEGQARVAAELRAVTRRAGLSLGDRACLALARHLQCSVVTADRAWIELDVGVEVILIR